MSSIIYAREFKPNEKTREVMLELEEDPDY
jgi:hypothetical protein